MQQEAEFASGSDQVLLATGSSGGTIAAVRQLSRSGIKVGVIASESLCAASWSRLVSRSYSGPIERKSPQFLDLLLSIGAAGPGQVLLPTSDETAWLYASNSSLLKRYYRLHLPTVETMRRIMDKSLLAAAARRAAVAVLPSWELRSWQELFAAANDLLYPILIKPRTQVHRVRNDKGMVARSAAELLEKFKLFVSSEQSECDGLALPDAGVPLLQHFVDIRSEGVHSVSGYIDESGELFVSRHARKILQRSQPAGVGVCFESLPVAPELSDSVRRLCRELGYFGIFEVEFIRFRDQWAVIDFNPRLFNQAGMDAHRGMPLALLAYLDAAGRRAELEQVVAQSQEGSTDLPAVFYDRFTLGAMLTAKSLTGRASPGERQYWRSWTRQHAGHAIDFAFDRNDPMPAVIHAVSEFLLGVRAFRKFLRSTSRAQSHAQSLLTEVAS